MTRRTAFTGPSYRIKRLSLRRKQEFMTQSANPFENSALTTILVVSNMEKSKAFYVDRLGCSIFRAYGGDSLVLEFLGNWLLLVTAGEPTKDKPKTHFLPPKNKDEVSHSFTIRVNDCQQSYEILESRGVDFITPPMNRGAETSALGMKFVRDIIKYLWIDLGAKKEHSLNSMTDKQQRYIRKDNRIALNEF